MQYDNYMTAEISNSNSDDFNLYLLHSTDTKTKNENKTLSKIFIKKLPIIDIGQHSDFALIIYDLFLLYYNTKIYSK
jgi:hypothetical protein